MEQSTGVHRACSVARTLEILGDRWTFLILREAFFGVRRFEAFQKKLGIARNILTDRLKHLLSHEILERQQYEERPPRFEYRLTERGLDLYGIVLAFMRWGDRWLAGDAGVPLLLIHDRCGRRLRPSMVCTYCGEEAEARDISYRDGPGERSPGAAPKAKDRTLQGGAGRQTGRNNTTGQRVEREPGRTV
jgi:DNA-binding HxlR family transcriptional regulator